MVVCRASGVDRARLEQRADLVERCRVLGVVLAVDRDVAGGRPVEAEDQAHRGRLAGPVRAEEAGDDAGSDGEREVVDRALLAVVLHEPARLDHPRNVWLDDEKCVRVSSVESAPWRGTA
jgi:hypothetical protein